MRHSLASTFALFGTLTFMAVGACGGDDENPATGKAGSAGAAASAGSGGSSGTGTGGTISGSGPSLGGQLTTSPEPTGTACQVANDCYAGLDTDELSGPAVCIDKVDDGYCTHECETDDDCCALEGECRTGFRQVCASFENSDKKYCFLSCEDEDLVPGSGGMTGAGGAVAVDSNEYCEREAHERFLCRSTGGGSENKKACLPDAGAAGAGAGGSPTEQGGAGGVASEGGAPAAAGAAGAAGADAGAGGQSEGGMPSGGAPAIP
jgi:hypothetical protein